MSSKLDKFVGVMEEVYGKYTGPNWIPKGYEDNKSRYLWTDAFGVCNFITLFYETGDSKFLGQADNLIKNVHDVLGKDREGKKRLGNSTDEEPLKGGLRIGKIEPEERPDGDGQYFHYLTKWMFALNRMSIAKKEPKYNEWAIQLAESTHPHFVYNTQTSAPRMHWKISIDMSQAVVKSEGNLDPFDGYITYKILQETAGREVLKKELADMTKMVNNKYHHYDSNDPLDLGEALWISHWYPEETWASTITTTSIESLEDLWSGGYFNMSLKYRLAFREFGTCIGVQTNKAASQRWQERVPKLLQLWEKYMFGRDRDITPIMYCSSLIPGVWQRDYKPKQSM